MCVDMPLRHSSLLQNQSIQATRIATMFLLSARAVVLVLILELHFFGEK